MTEHLEPLRQAIFDEIRSRTLETDLSVPVRSGDWWYYTRTFEDAQYSAHCRSPSAGRQRPQPEPGTPVDGEQVLLDGNVEAKGHEFFSLGALCVSADHRWLAYATDTEGDERFDLRIKDLSTGEVVDDEVTGIGYGCAFSLDARQVFYLRVDEAWRPFQLWRHEVGSPADQDVLVYEEGDPRFWMGVGVSRRPLAHAGHRFEDHLGDPARCGRPDGEFRTVAPA